MGCAWYFVGSEDANGWVFRSGVDSGPLAHRYATTLGCKGNIVLFRFKYLIFVTYLWQLYLHHFPSIQTSILLTFRPLSVVSSLLTCSLIISFHVYIVQVGNFQWLWQVVVLDVLSDGFWTLRDCGCHGTRSDLWFGSVHCRTRHFLLLPWDPRVVRLGINWNMVEHLSYFCVVAMIFFESSTCQPPMNEYPWPMILC